MPQNFVSNQLKCLLLKTNSQVQIEENLYVLSSKLYYSI